MSQKLIPSMTGYKATDADMRCRGHKFELGEWYEVDGELELCKNGFHFCDHWSGVWAYYDSPSTRIFKIEAEDVLDLPIEPGADHKRVCRRIRLVEEARPTDGHMNLGNWNSGYRNSGNGNSGHRNSGNRNSGDRNSGNRNSGDWNSGNGNSGHGNSGNENSGNRNSGNRNSGDRNSGHGNSGNRNSGDWNSGNENSGNRNSGNRNSGDWNSGNENSGNRNSGYGNCMDQSPDVFCTKPRNVQCFDGPTNLSYEELMDKHPEIYDLGRLLIQHEPIEFKQFRNIPNITPKKLQALHDAHLKARGLK